MQNIQSVFSLTMTKTRHIRVRTFIKKLIQKTPKGLLYNYKIIKSLELIKNNDLTSYENVARMGKLYFRKRSLDMCVTKYKGLCNQIFQVI